MEDEREFVREQFQGLARFHQRRLSSHRLLRLQDAVMGLLEDAVVAHNDAQETLLDVLPEGVAKVTPTVVLITGGAGFIGSNLSRHLLSTYPDYEVIAYDKLTYAGHMESLSDLIDNERFEFVRGDVTNSEAVTDVVSRCDMVVNSASESHVDRSLYTGGIFVETNVTGTKVLLNAAVEHNIERFLQVSSDAVYGSLMPNQDASERHGPNPRNVHATTMACADNDVFWSHSKFGLPTIVARCTNVYGPRQHPEKLVPLLITNAFADLPFPIYGEGQEEREWLYVDDCTAALDLLLHEGLPGDVYNVGSGKGGRKRNIEVAETLRTLMERPNHPIKWLHDRPHHDRRYAVDNSKTKSLGWRPHTKYEEGLQKTIDWYRENPEWWVPLKKEIAGSDFARAHYPEGIFESEEL